MNQGGTNSSIYDLFDQVYNGSFVDGNWDGEGVWHGTNMLPYDTLTLSYSLIRKIG